MAAPGWCWLTTRKCVATFQAQHTFQGSVTHVDQIQRQRHFGAFARSD
ncbi:MAG: hypothetical protein KatS3mg111_3388 [Pirellulaceae bacterium]|nr:MAG: hypothetical protein KatS3mg111_3388 [Pirellulaceae bacterium]